MLNELRQRRFPRFLAMVGELAELPRVQPELAGHLHVGVRQVVPLARLDPLLNSRRKGIHVLPQRRSAQPVRMGTYHRIHGHRHQFPLPNSVTEPAYGRD